MNVSIEVTGNLLDYLDKKVKMGLYKSRSEVVRSAIRLMIQQDLEEQFKEAGLDPVEFSKARKKISGELLEKRYKDLA
jgi:putative addiction module CopG family antidote